MVHISDTLQSFMPAKLKTWLKWAIYTEITYPDYQRTNPREYQIVRTHTKETA